MITQDRFTQQASPCHPEQNEGSLRNQMLRCLSMTTRRDNQEAAGFNRRKMRNEKQNER